MSLWRITHFEQPQDVGVGVGLHTHHQQVDQVLVGQLLLLTHPQRPHGDQGRVLVVVAVLVEQVRQQHTQQVARLCVGGAVAVGHTAEKASREQKDHRRNHVQA